MTEEGKRQLFQNLSATAHGINQELRGFMSRVNSKKHLLTKDQFESIKSVLFMTDEEYKSKNGKY